MELDDRFRLIRPDARVIDLGAAPGSWSQVALRRGAAHVVGIDLLPIDPTCGVTFLQGDFTAPETTQRLLQALGSPPTLILSDMAPNTTGHASTDHRRIMVLAEQAIEFAIETLAEGGAFVAKTLQGGTEATLLNALKRSFATTRHAKPAASRKESRELYVIAQGFRG